MRKVLRNARVLALNNLLVKALHVVRSERRHEGAHLIEHAAERPDVRFGVVRHIPPHLRRGVIRSASLGVRQAFFNNLGNIKVTKLGLHISVEEYVG